MSNEVSTKNEKRKREGEGTDPCKSVKMPEASEDEHEEDNNNDNEDEEDNNKDNEDEEDNNSDNKNLDLWQVRFPSPYFSRKRRIHEMMLTCVIHILFTFPFSIKA